VKAKNTDGSKHSITIITHVSLGKVVLRAQRPGDFSTMCSINRLNVSLFVGSLPCLFALPNILYLGKAWDAYWRGAGVRSQQYEFL
ncbi:MAG: hypothetical protein VW014_06165, partial [Halieaceae bacterium]